MPAFRLLRVGVKLFIRPLVLRCYQENPVFLSERRLGSHRSEFTTLLSLFIAHTGYGAIPGSFDQLSSSH